ncbi:KN motif and ankyrin repeat domain-containing protein 3 [Heteronotia binoei]|uniref:KN motif and ankyrin repeat domain-containing protein 3 n=1 Tax=Heteronotia binoei TaxID=13085 RepID=UPI00292FAE0E|nr:KN motif and ankyrin repeat domain-containing protein 3 [Heteronotia binoei]
MAQPTHLNRNLPGDEKCADLGGPFLYRNQDRDGEKASYSLETPYGFLLDLDFLKYVDDIESGQTFRKIPLNRKARGPKQALGSSRSQTGGWTSTESLSSTTSEDGKPVFSPRPRIWGSSSEPASKQASLPMSPPPVIHLLPPPSPKSLTRNTRVEKTLLETSKRLEQEHLGLLNEGTAVTTTRAPESPSKVASSPSFSQNISPFSVPLTGESQVDFSLPLTGPVKMSPSNSGRSTPATAVSPAHLHHVRDQMAAALRQLKELEEQVKTIPVLKMKICRLKKEKEQLVAGLWEKSQLGEAFTFDFPPKSPSMETTINASLEDSREATDSEPSKGRSSKIAELKKLTEKLSVSEKAVKVNKGTAPLLRAEEHTRRSVGVGEEINMDEAIFYYRSQRPCREVAVGWETETKDAEVWVMESLLGLSAETEREIELLQQTVQHQREVISMLEGHLKEATEELEELRVAVCLRMPKSLISKETMAQPETVEVSTEAVPTTQCQAVGGHVETAEKGVLFSPQVACVGVGCCLNQEDLMPIRSRSKATQVDLEVDSKAPRQNDVSTMVEPDGKEDVPMLEDANVSKSAVTEVHEVPSPEAEIRGMDPESHLQLAAVEEENVQRSSDKSSLGRTETGALKSIMKKRDGISKAEAGIGRKSLQFVGVLNGEYESTSSEEEEDQSPEKGSPLSSDSDAAASTDTSDEEVVANLEDSDPESPLPVVAARVKAQQRHEREKTEEENVALEVKEKFELSPRMREACLVVRSHLGHGGGGVKTREVVISTSLILQEWFRVSSQKFSLASQVADHLLAFSEISPAILAHVVNLSDGNGNTALHYSVSHSNFDIVQLLLNTGVSNVNHQNKAGYTALMLAALAAVEREEDMAVVRRLFALGNVNAKASQAGQTALMLAVSHGRQEMVEALLACEADINLQDEEGSTALMCACEHGRAGTVRLLLSQPTCDASIVDNDGNDAVSIALEAGHREIAALISTHLTQVAAHSSVS